MKRRILYLTFFAVFVFPPAAFPEDARIDDVVVTMNQPIKVSFTVKNAFTKDIEEAIKSGLPTSFTFIVELYRLNNYWFDEHLGTWRFNHTVKYDSLKEEYELALDERGERGIRTKDLEEVKRLMTTSTNVPVNTTQTFKKGEVYELRIMAELDTIDLPFLLNYMLFFVKLWDFETDWYTYRFSP